MIIRSCILFLLLLVFSSPLVAEITISNLPHTISTSNGTYLIVGTRLASDAGWITMNANVYDVILDFSGVGLTNTDGFGYRTKFIKIKK